MATINEQVVTGRKFRKLVDEATKLWQRISFWTKASDVEFNDGSTAETKMGAINGITDSLVSTSSNVAASAKALNQLNNKLANGRVELVITDNAKLGYKLDGADTVYPFKRGDFILKLQAGVSLVASGTNAGTVYPVITLTCKDDKVSASVSGSTSVSYGHNSASVHSFAVTSFETL